MKSKPESSIPALSFYQTINDMKPAIYLLFCFLLASTRLYSAASSRLITAQDSIIFDLNSSTLTANSIEFEVLIKSDDVINSFDFAFQFNTTKLSFFSTTTLLAGNNSVSHTSYFNPTDLYLRSTLSSLAPLPINQYLLKIKFTLAAPCIALTTADFYNLSAILNGVACSCAFRPLVFSNFIPVVSFTSTPTCVNKPSIYNSTSTLSKGLMQTYTWQIATQYSQTAQTLAYTYTSANVYPVSLTVCSTAGCCSSLTIASTLNPVPQLTFNYSVNCQNDSVAFIPASSILPTSFSSFNWQFEKSMPLETGFNPKHHFPLHGSYNVLFIVKDFDYCVYQTKQQVYVKPADINQDGLSNVSDFLILSPRWELDCD